MWHDLIESVLYLREDPFHNTTASGIALFLIEAEPEARQMPPVAFPDRGKRRIFCRIACWSGLCGCVAGTVWLRSFPE